MSIPLIHSILKRGCLQLRKYIASQVFIAWCYIMSHKIESKGRHKHIIHFNIELILKTLLGC